MRNWDFIAGAIEYRYRTLRKKILWFNFDYKMIILDIMGRMSKIDDPG